MKIRTSWSLFFLDLFYSQATPNAWKTEQTNYSKEHLHSTAQMSVWKSTNYAYQAILWHHYVQSHIKFCDNTLKFWLNRSTHHSIWQESSRMNFSVMTLKNTATLVLSSLKKYFNTYENGERMYHTFIKLFTIWIQSRQSEDVLEKKLNHDSQRLVSASTTNTNLF